MWWALRGQPRRKNRLLKGEGEGRYWSKRREEEERGGGRGGGGESVEERDQTEVFSITQLGGDGQRGEESGGCRGTER